MADKAPVDGTAVPPRDPQPDDLGSALTRVRGEAPATVARAVPSADPRPEPQPAPEPPGDVGAPAEREATPEGGPPRIESGPSVRPQPSAPLRHEPQDGDLLLSRYRLQVRLGAGGMGVVFRAYDQVLDKAVAIKILRPAISAQPAAVKALRDEVKKSLDLNHEHLIKVFHFETIDDTAIMIMELLDGRALDWLMGNQHARGMPLAHAWPIIEGTGKALAYLHDKGIIHSDFKPSNVFVTASGGPKLIDLGVARAFRRAKTEGSASEALTALTPEYASVEMLELWPEADQRDDVYSFGVVVYELLSGKHPFDSLPATEARDKLGKGYSPPRVRGLARRQNRALAAALCFSRPERAPSIDEVLRELRPRGANRRLVGSVLVALVLVTAALAYVIYGIFYGPQDKDEPFIVAEQKAACPNRQGMDPGLVAVLMDQGREYLAASGKAFDPGVLSENPSSAVGAFRTVLCAEPDNRAAAEGVLNVFKAYSSEATRLYKAGQLQQAGQLAEIGLRIRPDSVDLTRVRNAVLRDLAAAGPPHS